MKEAPTQELGVDVFAAFRPLGGGITDSLVGPALDYEKVAALRWPSSVTTFRKMRNDTQLSGLYRGTTLPIRRYVWGIDANGARPDIVAGVVQDFNLELIENAWKTFLTGESKPRRRAQNRFTWDNHLRDAQRSLYYGHYYFELHGTIGDDNLWHPEDASPRAPESLNAIWAAQNGDLVAVRQGILNIGLRNRSGLAYPELEASRLVAYVNDQEPGDWYGRSLFRSCFREWDLKDRLLRVDAVNHEKAGGILLTEAPAGATPAQMEALGQLAALARVGGGGAIPEGTKPVFIRGTGSDVIASINRHDESMAREFLMMFMALGTSSAGGNRALSQSFLDWFAIAQEAIAIFLRDSFQQQAIDRYVQWNFGDQDYVPLISFKRPEDANPLDMIAQGMATPDQAGEPGAVAVTDSNDDTIPVAAVRYGKTGRLQLVPQIVVDDETADVIRTAHAEFEAWAGRKTAASRRTLPPRAAATPPTVGHRQPNSHEEQAQVDFAQIDQQWTAQTGGLVDAWKGIRSSQIDALIQQITDADGDLAALAAISVEAAGADILTSHLHTMAALGSGQALAEAKKQGLTAAAAPDLTDTNAALTVRADALAQLLATSISQAAATKAVQLTGGASDTAAVAAGVRSYLNGLSDAWLHDQLGGALSAAQNNGRLAAMRQNNASHYYASELLDENTCEPCAAEDGTEFATADEAAAAYPAGGYADCDGGPRCRGTVVAVYDEAAPSGGSAT